MITERELPNVVLFEHVSLPESPHRYYPIILHSPNPSHTVHRSSEDNGGICLFDVLDCFDNVFMRLPLSYLHKLEFFEERFHFRFLIITWVVTCMICIGRQSNLSFIDCKDPPRVSFKVPGDNVDSIEVKFCNDRADILNSDITHFICYNKKEATCFWIIEGIDCRDRTHLLQGKHISPTHKARMCLGMRFC